MDPHSSSFPRLYLHEGEDVLWIWTTPSLDPVLNKCLIHAGWPELWANIRVGSLRNRGRALDLEVWKGQGKWIWYLDQHSRFVDGKVLWRQSSSVPSDLGSGAGLLLGHRALPLPCHLFRKKKWNNNKRRERNKEPDCFYPSVLVPLSGRPLESLMFGPHSLFPGGPQQLMPRVLSLAKEHLLINAYFLKSRWAFCFKDAVLRRSKTL